MFRRSYFVATGESVASAISAVILSRRNVACASYVALADEKEAHDPVRIEEELVNRGEVRCHRGRRVISSIIGNWSIGVVANISMSK